ncbi:MAG: OB-fold nucleic acid binding domain-containing protein, partial [Candidatus Binatia bacterium]
EKTLGIPLFQEQVMKLAVVGADYTPGEADQLRRDMAAWRTAGCIERHRELLISRMIAKGIRREFAERVFEQIRGFGEYGFPESHAASFALIAYATAWLKYHHPAEFACALLNSQPMGFYSPATIVDDTKRHDVTVLPIDLCKSSWDCSLEEDPQWDQDPASGPSRSDPAHPSPKRFAIRMGLRYLKGVSVEQGREIERARRQGEFTSLEDFVKRCPLDEKTLKTVVEAGALDAFGFDRRQTLWRATGLQLNHSDSLPLCVSEQIPLFPTLTDMEIVSWDYLSSSHSTRGHPLSALRGKLSSLGLPDASTLSTMADGSRAHYAGLVICRQRPYPAGGVVFMTLEDETGFVNLVIWQRVFEQYAALAKSRSFLGVSGRIQSEQGLVHLLVERLWSPQVGFAPQHIRSRDFH